jgi:hypothetical protein
MDHREVSVKKTLVSAIAVTVALGVSSAASAAMITFDDANGFTHGDDLTTMTDLAVAGSGVTYNVGVTGPNDNSALVFDTSLTGTPDPDLEDPFDDPGTGATETLSPGNILIIGNNNGAVDDDPDGGTITFTFSEEVSFVSFRLFDTGDSGSDGIDVTIEDSGGSTTDFLNVGAGLGDNEFTEFSFGPTQGQIASFTFDGSGGIDNLNFTEVPVPATLSLMGAGLLATGFAARRRHTRGARR